jgi:glycosyltransferase involved in cell wall biosynthesis
MRIGFDITALYVAQAGVFWYDYNLIRALLEQDQGNDYLLLDYYPIHGGWTNPPEIQELEASRAKVVHCRGLRHRRLARWRPLQLPGLRTVAGLVDRTLFWPWSAATKEVMHRQLTRLLDGVDVFHSSDVMLWKQPGALNVVTIYDLTALLFPEYHTADTRELQQRKYRFAQEEADAVIAISEATKRDIVSHLEIPAERVHVVHGGTNPAFRPIEDRQAVAQALAPLGLVPGNYILYVGTIEPRKNLVRLVEAYNQVRRMVSAPVPKLVLVGGAGWQFHDVFARIEALDLKNMVVYAGRVSTDLLPALYNGAVLFVYPSLYEGFGLPPLEAMACGVPVVTSNVSSLPEIVGDAGVLVDPTDTQALVATLATLLGDAQRRSDMVARGLARAERFSWTRAAQETLAIYNRESLHIGRCVGDE